MKDYVEFKFTQRETKNDFDEAKNDIILSIHDIKDFIKFSYKDQKFCMIIMIEEYDKYFTDIEKLTIHTFSSFFDAKKLINEIFNDNDRKTIVSIFQYNIYYNEYIKIMEKWFTTENFFKRKPDENNIDSGNLFDNKLEERLSNIYKYKANILVHQMKIKGD